MSGLSPLSCVFFSSFTKGALENGAVVSLRGAAGPSSQLLACVCARTSVCVCDIEDSGDSLLKQYNGHLSPRGVIQIQYQATSCSTLLSAFATRAAAAAFPPLLLIFFIVIEKEPGGQRGIHPASGASRCQRAERGGWRQERSPLLLQPLSGFCHHPWPEGDRGEGRTRGVETEPRTHQRELKGFPFFLIFILFPPPSLYLKARVYPAAGGL